MTTNGKRLGEAASTGTVARPPLVPLDEGLRDALARGPVLTPTRRLAREIEYAVDWDCERGERGQRGQRGRRGVWATPDVSSTSAFLARSYAEAQDAGVPGAEALLLADDIAPFAMIGAVPKAEWTPHVQTFAEAWRTAKLHGIPSVHPGFAQTENGQVYARWAQAFEAKAAEQGWITTAELPDRLVRLMDGPTGWRPRPATAIALEEPAPAVRRFLVAARNRELALAQRPAAHTAQRLATGDGAQEQALAAVWARERLSANANARIGVVLPRLGAEFGAIERRFQALFADVREPADYVNVSGGMALADEPAARDALEFLEFTVGVDRAAMRSLAQSPFLQLDLQLDLPVDGLPEHASLPALAARRDATPKLRRLAEVLEQGRRRPPWAPLVWRLLRLAGWAVDGLGSREIQAKRRFEECQDAFAIAERVGALRDWPAAVAALRQLAALRLFAPRSAAAPIQVLGRAESAGLVFDHLWLAGLAQAAWPPVPSPNPFLPHALQRGFGVRGMSLEEERRRASATTERWRRAAGQVVASHAGEDAGPSALIARFAPVAVDAIVRQPSLAAHGHPWAVARPVELERRVDENAGPAPNTAPSGGATVLQDQSLCPFRAWARHRLGLKEAPVRGRFPGAAERGTVVHEILARLLRGFPTQDALGKLGAEDIAAAVRETLQEQKRWPPRYRVREAERLRALMAQWFALESGRSPFRVVAVEEDVRVRIDAGVGELTLNLRIDRIDAVDTAGASAPPGLVLIDFKTGRTTTRAWDAPRPEEPQLPLYALAVATSDPPLLPGTVRGVAFARVRPDDVRLDGFADSAAEARPLRDPGNVFALPFADLRATWDAALGELARGFLAGRAAVDPVAPTTCSRCHLQALCRIADEP